MLQRTFFILGISILIIGCMSPEPQITEIDPKDILHLENRYDTHDLDKHVESMVHSLFRHKIITDEPEAPRIMLGEVVIDDSFDEGFDAGKIIQESVRHNLINSKLVIFVDIENQKAIKEDFQIAKYKLDGKLFKNYTKNNQKGVVIYTLFMTLKDRKEKTIIWEHKEVVVKQIK